MLPSHSTSRRCRPKLWALLLLALLAAVLAHHAAAGKDGGHKGDEDERPKTELNGAYMTEKYKRKILTYVRSLGNSRRRVAPAQEGTSGWRQIGPDGALWQAQGGKAVNAGRVKKILQDPNNLNTVYVGFSAGGVWRTDDFFSDQSSWWALTDGVLSSVPTTSVGAMTLGAADPNRIYLGLGDFTDVRPTLGGVVCTSPDRGNTFDAANCVPLPGQTAVRDIKVAPRAGLNGADQVIVAASAGAWISGDESIGGVFVSRNAGRTFKAARIGASCWSLAQTSIGWLAACKNGNSSEIWRSTNNGVVFARYIPAPFGAGAGRATLAVLKPGSNVVYALVGSAEGSGNKYLDIFRSNKGGAIGTWLPLRFLTKPVTNPPPADVLDGLDASTVGGNFWGQNSQIGQAWYNQMLLVDPHDSTGNTFYFGANMISAKTTNGGKSFKIMTWWLDNLVEYGIPYAHADHHAASSLVRPAAQNASMAAMGLSAAGSAYGGAAIGTTQDEGTVEESGAEAQQAPSCVLVFGTDGGITVSYDGQGGQLDMGEKNIGIATMLVDVVSGTPLAPDLVVAGTQDNSVRSRVGATTDWNAISGGDGTGVALSQAGTAGTGCMLGQTNWAGCPWKYNLKVLADNVDEVLNTNTEADSPACGTGVNSIVDADSEPNRAAGFVVPPVTADKTGQVFYMKFARTIFRTRDCGMTWVKWAGVTRGQGLPLPIVQDSGDEDPCMDSGCDNTGSALWAGWAEASGSITVAIHPLDLRKVASLLFVSHLNDDPATNAIAITIDDGATWRLQSFGINDWYPSLTTSPTWSADGRKLYVAYTAAGTGWPYRILVNNDPLRTSTWTPLSAPGLPADVQILRMLAHPKDPNTLYIANWLGVYVTVDAGATFQRLGDTTDQPLPLVQVSDLHIIPNGAGYRLRAGTRGRSVFEIDI